MSIFLWSQESGIENLFYVSVHKAKITNVQICGENLLNPSQEAEADDLETFIIWDSGQFWTQASPS